MIVRLCYFSKVLIRNTCMYIKQNNLFLTTGGYDRIIGCGSRQGRVNGTHRPMFTGGNVAYRSHTQYDDTDKDRAR